MSVLSGAQLLKPVDFALNRRPFAFPPQPFERAGALGGRGRATSVAAMLVTSWAFTVLRRCNSVDGKRSGGSSCRLRAISKISRPGQLFEIVVVQLGERLQRRRRYCGSGPKSALFPPVSAARTAGSSRVVTVVWRLTAALRISARTTSSVILALCAIRSANWSRAAASGIRAATVEHLAEKLPPAVVVARGRARSAA